MRQELVFIQPSSSEASTILRSVSAASSSCWAKTPICTTLGCGRHAHWLLSRDWSASSGPTASSALIRPCSTKPSSAMKNGSAWTGQTERRNIGRTSAFRCPLSYAAKIAEAELWFGKHSAPAESYLFCSMMALWTPSGIQSCWPTLYCRSVRVHTTTVAVSNMTMLRRMLLSIPRAGFYQKGWMLSTGRHVVQISTL